MPVKDLIQLAKREYHGDEQHKAAFHRKAQAVLRQLAERLGYTKADYDLRSNKAGPAVLGEVTLHSDTLYVQLGEPLQGRFMWRACRGRKDYAGGPNQWATYDELRDLPVFAEKIQRYATIYGSQTQ